MREGFRVFGFFSCERADTFSDAFALMRWQSVEVGLDVACEELASGEAESPQELKHRNERRSELVSLCDRFIDL